MHSQSFTWFFLYPTMRTNMYEVSEMYLSMSPDSWLIFVWHLTFQTFPDFCIRIIRKNRIDSFCKIWKKKERIFQRVTWMDKWRIFIIKESIKLKCDWLSLTFPEKLNNKLSARSSFLSRYIIFVNIHVFAYLFNG